MTVAGHTVSHYEILDHLGGGGMGVVYRACDIKLDRLAALKFLPPELSGDEEANARFMIEAKAASALDHTNICTIYEIGEADDGRLFIAMPLYEGKTLKQGLQEGAFAADEALSITRQIAEGLATAHKKEIVHRDIKPANIMLTDDGRAVILDFGLAKLPGVLALTKTGSTLGTAAYMPPEQIRGEKIDGRADLWSLGVVLYEMLTGRRPFEADYEQALSYAILNEEVSRPEDLEEDVSAIVLKLLSKDPSDRYPDAETLLQDLDTVIESRRPPSGSMPVEQPGSAGRRKRVTPMAIGIGIAIGATVAVAILAAILIMRSGVEEERRAIDPNMIAVMPFAVRGNPELDYLGIGLVDLLSMRLDGVAGFKSADPNALLALIARDELEITGPAEAVALAHRLGAGKAILGGVISTGGAIQISVSLYADPEERLIEATEASADEEGVPASLDAVAKELLFGLSDVPVDESLPLASMTSSSFEAVKSYLNGVRELRLGRLDDAISHLEDAVDRDSTFALAWAFLSQSYGWFGRSAGEAEALGKAFRLRGSLPMRAQNLIAGSYYGFVDGGAEKGMDLYRTVLASYPHDLTALWFMGELTFHYNPLLGKTESEARQYFEAANEFGMESVGLLDHLRSIAIEEGRYAEAESLGYRLVTLSGDPGRADFQAHVSGLVRRTQGDSSWVFDGLGEMTAFESFRLWEIAATGFEDTEAAAQIASFVAGSESLPRMVTSRAQFVLGYSTAAEGRFRDQVDIWAKAGPDNYGNSILERSLAMVIPVYPASDDYIRSLRAEVNEWDTLASPVASYSERIHDGEYWAVKAYLDALLSMRLGDTERFEAGMEVLAGRADSTSGKDLPFSLSRSLEAIETWKAGRFEHALDLADEARLRILWRQAHRSMLYKQVVDRFVKAEVLLELGEIETALELYRSLTAGGQNRGLVFLGPSYLRQAEIHERLGDPTRAIEYYARLIRLWKNCDPELIPMREEARRNLDRLLAESTREPAS